MGRVNNFLYEDITYKIRGACFKVWNEFGSSVKENIIEKSLCIEMHNLGLKVERQKRIDIFYKNQKVGTYIPDLIINNVILIELKRKPFISRDNERQFWLYLKGSEYKLGLLINFGPNGLDIRRRIYDKARNSNLVECQRGSALEISV